MEPANYTIISGFKWYTQYKHHCYTISIILVSVAMVTAKSICCRDNSLHPGAMLVSVLEHELAHEEN